MYKLKKKDYNIEDLFVEIRNKKDINLNQFLNAITFLWIAEAIEYNNLNISIKAYHVSK